MVRLIQTQIKHKDFTITNVQDLSDLILFLFFLLQSKLPINHLLAVFVISSPLGTRYNAAITQYKERQLPSAFSKSRRVSFDSHLLPRSFFKSSKNTRFTQEGTQTLCAPSCSAALSQSLSAVPELSLTPLIAPWVVGPPLSLRPRHLHVMARPRTNVLSGIPNRL